MLKRNNDIKKTRENCLLYQDKSVFRSIDGWTFSRIKGILFLQILLTSTTVPANEDIVRYHAEDYPVII